LDKEKKRGLNQKSIRGSKSKKKTASKILSTKWSIDLVCVNGNHCFMNQRCIKHRIMVQMHKIIMQKLISIEKQFRPIMEIFVNGRPNDEDDEFYG
jgi:hypothetical protein